MILKNLSYNFWDNKLMNIYKRIILFIALISFLLSCKNSTNANVNVNTNNISSVIFEEIIEEDIIHEDIIEEDIIHEDIIYEDIIYEDITYEAIIHEIEIFEDTIYEDIIVEDIDMQFTTIKDFKDNFDNCFSSDALMYDIDWAGVIGKFSVGTAVIVCTGVISFASASLGQPQLAFVFATSSKEAIKNALIGAATGGVLNTIVETIKNGGAINETALKYAIEGAADGFMWGAIAGATLGLYKGFNILAKNPILDSSGRLIGIPDEMGNLLDDAGKIKGAILRDNFIEDNSHRIIGKLDDNGKLIKNYKSYIPDNNRIYTVSSKNPRYKIKNKGVYLYRNDEYIGQIDDAGRIIKDGILKGEIDANGKLIPSIQESINRGVVLSPDGKVLNLNGLKIEKSTDRGIRNIKNSEGRIIGQIDDNNRLISDWREKNINPARRVGVKSAKDCIIANKLNYLEAIKIGVIDKSVSKEAYEMFLETGKGLEGHHIKNVANNPNYANRLDNIIFMSRQAHKEAHSGNFQNATKGNFTKLKCKLK